MTTTRRKGGAATSTVELSKREADLLADIAEAGFIGMQVPKQKARLARLLMRQGLATESHHVELWMYPTTEGRRLAGRAELSGRNGAIKMGGSTTTRNRKLAARPHAKTDTSTYSGRLGLAIRKRRQDIGVSVADIVTALNVAGFNLQAPAVYNWETGVNPIPMNALPTLAKVLKTTVHELLPPK